ncbi:MAG: non-homologous end-joining DNA ligase [Candidatus Dormibacteria bacterium]
MGEPQLEPEVAQALEDLAQLPARGGPLRVGSRLVPVSRLDKKLWPEDGITKRELIEYELRISAFLLPHLRDRAVVIQAFPDGIGGKSFWRRVAPDTAPRWIPRWKAHPGAPTVCPLVQEAAALVWFANQGAIEIHPWHSRRDRPTRPDWAVFDLDPGSEGGWEEAITVARMIKAELDRVGLRAWLKTTGQSGLHIYVPLRRRVEEDQVRVWVGQLASQVARALPDLVSEEWKVGERRGRLRVDYTQNVVGKTLAAVYSPRPAPGAPVSAPIEWDELDRVDPRLFTIRTVLERVRLHGDLFLPVLRGGQSLPRLPSNSRRDPARGEQARRK